MNRYFYPACRAHHAICMGIDFGMKFARSHGQLWILEGLLDIRHAKDYQIMVAEESLHLLEPRSGDVIETDYVNSGLDVHYAFPGQMLASNEWIIQRNGLPFHMPEELLETVTADGA